MRVLPLCTEYFRRTAIIAAAVIEACRVRFCCCHSARMYRIRTSSGACGAFQVRVSKSPVVSSTASIIFQHRSISDQIHKRFTSSLRHSPSSLRMLRVRRSKGMRLRNPIRIGIILSAFILVALQLIPVTSPPYHSAKTGGTPMRNAGMSPDMAHTIQRACGDCHSNETRWPWYSRIAPVSWMVRRDVARGRQALNFSEWLTRDTREKAVAASNLLATCEELRYERMPPRTYRFMHQESRLSRRQIEAYCEWSRAESRKLLSR
jgi:hypothetical protein